MNAKDVGTSGTPGLKTLNRVLLAIRTSGKSLCVQNMRKLVLLNKQNWQLHNGS
jgi:hypothetical protein